MSDREFRRGTLVEVRSPSEILATLDSNGELDALPFMPEMIPYIGQRFVVDGRAEKVCDTINWTGSRRVKDTVLLGDLRCDGSGHGGCEAECRLYWKEVWLRRVQPEDPLPSVDAGAAMVQLTEFVTSRASRRVDVGAATEELYTCQATELFRASEPLWAFDPIPYIRELTCGNVPLRKFVRITARAAVQEPMRRLRLVPAVHLKGPRTKPHDEQPLNLRAGELVQVKSREEIAETLTPKGRNRGLWFDREMLPFCGGTYRVRGRVKRFIAEQTGKMIELKSDCVTLEGVVCSGEHSHQRWFCPRRIYPYWREAWLRRVELGGAEK